MNINQFNGINYDIDFKCSREFLSSENGALKEQFLNFKEFLEKDINKINQWIANEKRKSSINVVANDLIANFNKFGISLNRIEYFKDEYYDYSDIQDMTIYILRRDKLISQDNLEFIRNISVSFIEILQSFGIKDYEEKYKLFQFKLVDFKQDFYNNVYTRSKYYDKDVLSEITNILLG